jgi:hypothetical protein
LCRKLSIIGGNVKCKLTFVKTAADDAIVVMPDVVELFAKIGGQVVRLSPADTDAFIRRAVECGTRLIKEAGISAGQRSATLGPADVADACGSTMVGAMQLCTKRAGAGHAAVDGVALFQ